MFPYNAEMQACPNVPVVDGCCVWVRERGVVILMPLKPDYYRRVLTGNGLQHTQLAAVTGKRISYLQV